jgi:hypothetical protein
MAERGQQVVRVGVILGLRGVLDSLHLDFQDQMNEIAIPFVSQNRTSYLDTVTVDNRIRERRGSRPSAR